MPQHGFARRRPFALIEHGKTKALFRLGADAETLATCPFALSLETSFRVGERKLSMAAPITNNGDSLAPFSSGFHPSFAWQLSNGAKAGDHPTLFDGSEPASLRDIDLQSGLIPANRQSPVDGRQPRAKPPHSVCLHNLLLTASPPARAYMPVTYQCESYRTSPRQRASSSPSRA